MNANPLKFLKGLRNILASIFLSFVLNFFSEAQNVVITDDTTYVTGHPSAVLDIYSDSRGVLVPRMTYNQRSGISNLIQGLIIYQTDSLNGFYYYDGSAWVQLSSTDIRDIKDSDGDTWLSVENEPDNDRILLTVRDSSRLVVDSTGNIGIGTTSPAECLHLKGGELVTGSLGKSNRGGIF